MPERSINNGYATNHEADSDNADQKKTIITTDIYNPEGMERLSQALAQSGGRALIFIHPFFELNYTQGIEEQLPEDKQSYLKRMKHTIKKVNELENGHNRAERLPIVFFTEGFLGSWVRSESEVVLAQNRLKQNIDGFLGIPGEYFFIVTRPSDPHPLDTPRLSPETVKELIGVESYEKNYKPLNRKEREFIDFILQMRLRGLQQCIVGGQYFGGARNEFQTPYELVSPYKTKFHDLLSDLDDWKLGHQYRARRARRGDRRKHPFELIVADGCVPGALNTLAFSGIQVDVSTITYPLQLPVVSQIDDCGHIHKRHYRGISKPLND